MSATDGGWYEVFRVFRKVTSVLGATGLTHRNTCVAVPFGVSLGGGSHAITFVAFAFCPSGFVRPTDPIVYAVS